MEIQLVIERLDANPDEPPFPPYASPGGYHHFGIQPLEGYSGVLLPSIWCQPVRRT